MIVLERCWEGHRVAETVKYLCLIVLMYCLTNLGTVSRTEFMWH
jgi:hypothetical protein